VNFAFLISLTVPFSFFVMLSLEPKVQARDYVPISTGLFLGLSPEVASAVSSTLVVLSTFQHWNINTPRALGYIISRPEMHALHHEFDIHARNYSEFAIWDMIFGTYENPMHFEGRVGFVDSAASRLKDMLLMRNVNL